MSKVKYGVAPVLARDVAGTAYESRVLRLPVLAPPPTCHHRHRHQTSLQLDLVPHDHLEILSDTVVAGR